MLLSLNLLQRDAYLLQRLLLFILGLLAKKKFPLRYVSQDIPTLGELKDFAFIGFIIKFVD